MGGGHRDLLTWIYGGKDQQQQKRVLKEGRWFHGGITRREIRPHIGNAQLTLRSGCVFILPDLTYLQDVHNDFIKQVEVDVVLYTLQGSWGVVIIGSPGEKEKKAPCNNFHASFAKFLMADPISSTVS